MLSFKKQLLYLSLVSLFLLFSCQSEIEEQVYNTQETITKSSPITSYLQRVAMVQTIQDNIIDKSSYCTIKLPYKVTVNYATISINTAADYQKVLDNINAYTNDNDIVKITFPVTMIYYNYVEKVITNQTEFESLLSYWSKYPDLLSKINCVNINYPITIDIYNSANQIASSVKIESDSSFFSFINNLNESQFIALKYPISISDNNSVPISIANNSQFENAIKHAIDTCPDNVNANLNFIQILTTNTWKISYYSHESGKTSDYNGYTFVFNSYYKVIATKSGVTYYGTWSSKLDNGVREFKIKLDAPVLEKLDEDWKVFEFNNSQLRFRDTDSNNIASYLYLEKI
ncbi:hypothetical protein C3L50_03590 [Flavobacterium alvei]|uniref:Lipoprotein n=1 Tax=Flavobacterium alvei TaxID=2080416 RepID=A0A2S5ADD1_9FLAO|nr:hypothetical protein [Flavobacterium alvei]POY40591.1 hypothetical protein C3L50_03590 [Flavobacterium alvei]